MLRIPKSLVTTILILIALGATAWVLLSLYVMLAFRYDLWIIASITLLQSTFLVWVVRRLIQWLRK